MNDTTASDCTCPSGDGSLRHPCPTHPLQRAQAQPAAAQEAVGRPEPYIVGNQYRTQAGDLVRFVAVHHEGTSYECMEDEAGVNRYTRRDFGRVTGTCHEYSDPRNTPPLYAAPVAAAPAVDVATLRALADRWANDRSYTGSPVDDIRALIEQPTASTPAAPGIDTSPKGAATAPRFELTNGQIAQLADFAGTPNAGAPLEEQDVLVIQHTDAGHSGPGLYAHYDELPDEGAIHLDGQLPYGPRGGSDAITDSDRIDFVEREFLHIEPVEIRASEDDADVGWEISQNVMRSGKFKLIRSDNDNLRSAIDAAMQATSAEVGS